MIFLKKKNVLFVSLFCLLSALTFTRAQTPGLHSSESLQVLGDSINGIASNHMMTSYLHHLADQAWNRWKDGYENRNDAEQIKNHYEKLKNNFISAIGGLPERTPLNAQITGVLHRDRFQVEKILFESRPKHFVSANLYLPASSEFKPPYPGVLIPCGHYNLSKAHDEYQSMGALMALNGIAALVYDPIGQGERLQIRDNDGSGGHDLIFSMTSVLYYWVAVWHRT